MKRIITIFVLPAISIGLFVAPIIPIKCLAPNLRAYDQRITELQTRYISILQYFIFPPKQPTAPTDLMIGEVGFTHVNLAWNDKSEDETGFLLIKSTDSNFTKEVTKKILPPNTSFYSAIGEDFTTYYFLLCSFNKYCISSSSNVVYITTPSLNITKLTSPVRPGRNATLIAETMPGAKCSIAVHYLSGLGQAAGLQSTPIADENGKVSWTWLVGTRTTPGTYNVDVTANYKGDTITKRTELTIVTTPASSPRPPSILDYLFR